MSTRELEPRNYVVVVEKLPNDVIYQQRQHQIKTDAERNLSPLLSEGGKQIPWEVVFDSFGGWRGFASATIYQFSK